MGSRLSLLARSLGSLLGAITNAVIKLLPILISTCALFVAWLTYEHVAKRSPDVQTVLLGIGRCSEGDGTKFYVKMGLSNDGDAPATLYDLRVGAASRDFSGLRDNGLMVIKLGTGHSKLPHCGKEKVPHLLILAAGETKVLNFVSKAHMYSSDEEKGEITSTQKLSIGFCELRDGTTDFRERYLGTLRLYKNLPSQIGLSPVLQNPRVRVLSRLNVACSPEIDELVGVETMFGQQPIRNKEQSAREAGAALLRRMANYLGRDR